jgi:hypothetical protein
MALFVAQSWSVAVLTRRLSVCSDSNRMKATLTTRAGTVRLPVLVANMAMMSRMIAGVAEILMGLPLHRWGPAKGEL